MKQLIFIHDTFPSLNDYIEKERIHRLAGAKMKGEQTDRVAWQVKKMGKFTKPVTIHFRWHEINRKRDPDNIIFAKKFVLDGLVVAGVLPNDTQKYIKGFYESIVINPSKPGVEILIVDEDG